MSDKIYAKRKNNDDRVSEVTGSPLGDTAFGMHTAKPGLAVRTDGTTTSNTTYVGTAEIGSLQSSASWKIFRMVDNSGDLTITYADGNDNFDNIWDNRASLSYS